MRMPCGVSSKAKVKASKGQVEPIQTNLFGRQSIVGPKWSAWASRVAELMPSETTTRSWSRSRSSTDPASARKRRSTPRSRARSARTRSSVVRAKPQKPLPPMRCTVPLWRISMSSQ